MELLWLVAGLFAGGLLGFLWASLLHMAALPEVEGAHVDDDDDWDDWTPRDYLLVSASTFDFWDNELDAQYDADEYTNETAILRWNGSIE